jgi:zinc transporter
LKWDAADLGQGFDGAVWLHFSLADVRAQKWIAACEQIPAQARELLLNNDPHIRMEAAGRGFAGVLGDLHFAFDADPDRLGVPRLYVDEDIVVTARLHPLKAADLLRLEVRGGAAFESTTSLVIRFVEGVTDILTAVTAGQGEIVDEIEDRVLKDRFLRESEELGPVRRLLARLRRQVDAQRHALGRLAHRPPGWFRDKDTRSCVARSSALAGFHKIWNQSRSARDCSRKKLPDALGRPQIRTYTSFPFSRRFFSRLL